MATIRTVFTLVDNVSGPMGNINRATGTTTKGFESLAAKILSVNAVMQVFSMVANSFDKVKSSVEELVDTYRVQYENEVKLEAIMRTRMNSTSEDIEYIKQLASAEQQLGIYGDELILAGAQELSTFVSSRESLEKLIPAMNNMIAQHDGLTASTNTFVQAADMMGKVLAGNTSGLSKNGWIFTEQEKKMIEMGNEEQMVATLTRVITQNIGQMNRVLGETDIGAIQRLNNSIGDIKEQFGKLLTPVKRAFLEIKNNIMLYFKEPLENAIKSGIQNLDTFVATAIYVAGIISVVATAIAGAWIVANWPIALMITLIVTLGRAMFDLVGQANQTSLAINGVNNQITQAATTVGQFFGSLGSLVGGFFNTVYNVVADVYNPLAYLVEMLYNLFTDPLKAIEGFFINMASTVLDVVETLTGVFDFLLNTEWSEAVANANNKLLDWKKQQLGDDYWYAKRLDVKDVDWMFSGASTGAEIGAQVGSIMDTAFTQMTGTMPEIPEIPGLSFEDFTFDTDGALVVSDNRLVDIANDYKELLSKRASREFEIYLTNLTPQINISGTTIEKNVDVDEVIEEISDKVISWVDGPGYGNGYGLTEAQVYYNNELE